MTTTINASPTNGIVQTADGSGVMKLQSNGVTTNALAWVNFNGSGTVAIRASYNVSSITDNGTGDYTVNFTNALSDANYCIIGSTGLNAAGVSLNGPNNGSTPLTSSVRISTSTSSANYDPSQVNVAIFGN